LVMAYRKQKTTEVAEQREQAKLFNERFTTASTQLGDASSAVQLAGVYALARLADDWDDQRQTCIDVLCAFLRMPYPPEPDEETASHAERVAWRQHREVRHTVIRTITAHLRADAPVSWQGADLDFTGVVFDGGDFTDAVFSGTVDSTGAEFTGGTADFTRAEFIVGTADFTRAEFAGGIVDFREAKTTGGTVYMRKPEGWSPGPRFDAWESVPEGLLLSESEGP